LWARFETVSHFDSSNPVGNSNTASLTVLIVDDEPDVLRLVESILADDGYEVVTAKSADGAIIEFERLPRCPDLLLTDVVMPGMSGPMLVERLLESEPNLKVLFMSGYDDRQVVQRYVVERGFSLISKPFTVKALRLAVHEVIKDNGYNSKEIGR
jgi:two-component system cell cycle sensor histidine kinase/response regulator CckA